MIYSFVSLIYEQYQSGNQNDQQWISISVSLWGESPISAMAIDKQCLTLGSPISVRATDKWCLTLGSPISARATDKWCLTLGSPISAMATDKLCITLGSPISARATDKWCLTLGSPISVRATDKWCLTLGSPISARATHNFLFCPPVNCMARVSDISIRVASSKVSSTWEYVLCLYDARHISVHI